MPTLSRRAFAERLALGVAAPFILDDLPSLVIGRPGAAAPQRPEPLPPAPAAPVVGPPPSPLARALAEGVRLRYGDRLSAADLDTIARTIEARLQALEQLSRVPLGNGDEPDFVFAAYRGDP
jgi:hypothetical protein